MKIVLAAVLTTVVACSSKGAGVDGGTGGAGVDGGAGGAGVDSGAGGAGVDGGACRANTPAGASVSWFEDGAAKCAVTVVAQRSTTGANELLQVQAATLDGASVAFSVIAYGGALEGTHVCAGVTTADGGLIGTPGTFYVDFAHTGLKQDCSITITNGGTVGGANATGTFSATFTGTGGAVVTTGVFDTPVKAPPP